MAAPTYLYGYRGARLSLVGLEGKPTWNQLHPEFRRRLIGMFDYARANGHDVGIGGGWRSSETQRTLFLSRYDEGSCPGDWRWDNRCWHKRPGVAPAAPPGRSYHETCVTLAQGDWALAADIVGDQRYAATICAQFGMREFEKVNGELWHYQPVEIPSGRSSYRGQGLETWPIPTPPPPPPPAPPYPGPPPLKRGSKGPSVMLVQDKVGATIDGDFGPATERRVKAWQQANRLKPDGIVGPVTWAAMFPPGEVQ